MEHQEKVQWMAMWAAKNRMTLVLEDLALGMLGVLLGKHQYARMVRAGGVK